MTRRLRLATASSRLLPALDRPVPAALDFALVADRPAPIDACVLPDRLTGPAPSGPPLAPARPSMPSEAGPSGPPRGPPEPSEPFPGFP